MPKLETALPPDPGVAPPKDPRPAVTPARLPPDLTGLTVIEERSVVPERPIIDGAMVVYLGANRNPSIPLRGKIISQRFEVAPGEFRVVKEVSDEGFYNYAFESHDLLGNLIIENILGDGAPPELRGRPRKSCEHPEHLRVFMRMRNRAGQAEFKIMVPAHKRAEFLNYVVQHERAMRAHEENVREITIDH